MPVSELRVAQRPFPGAAYTLSEIAVAIDPPGPTSPGWASMAVPLLRKARAAGVTTFDLAATVSPRLAEEIFVRAFPERDPALVAIVGAEDRSAHRHPAPARGAGSSAVSADRPVEGTLARLGDRCRAIVEWDPADRGGTGGSRPPEALEMLRRSGRVLDIAVPIRTGKTHGDSGPAALRSGALSLLELDIVNAARRAETPAGFSLLARDVFASGSLDGTLLAGSPLSRSPAEPPTSLATLHARLDPVLGLSFLTERTGRTLAQAALQFALHWPWVRTAVVPLPTPERFSSIVGAPRGPPLTEEDLLRIGVEPSAGPPPSARTD